MWTQMMRSRLFWTILGVLGVAFAGRSMMRDQDQRGRARATRQLAGVVDMLSRTGRTVANGTMRMVRR